jgi:predicted dehydrogenase
MNFSRREFAKLSALSLAAELTPNLTPALLAQTPAPVPTPNSGRKIGYAIIGLGRIADHFMRGIQQTSNSQVVALVSGHHDKALTIARDYNVPRENIYNYENMDAFRDNKQIDAVYVALPNSMHAEYTIRSAKAGKHVLCEKPMAVSVPEAESMVAACKEANVKLMIAYRCHYEPTNLAAVKMIRDGTLGQIQQIQAAFGFNIGPTEWRVQKALAGGGPMMDVGIYCLNATRYLTGEEPASFSAYTHKDPNDPRFADVEENLAWITHFPSGVLASCNTTYSANMQGYFRVYGSKGWVQVTDAYSYDGLVLDAEYRPDNAAPGQKSTVLHQPNPEKDPMHFVREADHFSNCILTNQTPKTPGEEGLRDMQCIREIYKSAGITMA